MHEVVQIHMYYHEIRLVCFGSSPDKPLLLRGEFIKLIKLSNAASVTDVCCFVLIINFILLVSHARSITTGCWMLQQGEEIVDFPTEGLRHSFDASGEIPPKQRPATSVLFHSHADENNLTRVELIYGHVDEGRKSNEWSAYVLYLSPTRVKNELILSSTHSLSGSVCEHLEWVRVTPYSKITGKPRAGL